jgi:hypothetical protein
MSSWLTHLKNFYANRKKINPAYSYKNAMKDAVPSYRKSASTKSSHSNKSHKKKRGRTLRRRR